VEASWDHHPLFRVIANAQGQSGSKMEARVLIDSGATHNFVSRKFALQLDASNVTAQGRTLNLQFPNGTHTSTPLENLIMTVTIGKYEQGLEFILTDLDKYDLILGRPWLHRENPKLDWRTNVVRLRHRGKSVVFIANDDFGETDTMLATVEGSVTAQEAKRLEKEEGCSLFAVMVRRTDDVTTPGVRFGTDDPRVKAMYVEFKDLFPEELTTLPPSRGDLDHKIDLMEGATPAAGYTVRFSTMEIEMLQQTIDSLLKNGFISPSNSPFGAPCFFVKKPHGGGLRLVVDWRNLNNITVKDRTQLPNIADLLSLLHKARFFSILDGHSGFWQVLLRPEDAHKTAFRTPFGSFQWNVMGMGLCNAPATYQTLMNTICRPFLRKFVAVYLDDVLVFSNSLTEHLSHLRTVLETLRKHNIKCKPGKCVLAAEEVLFLGHLVGNGKIRVDPSKVAAIVEMQPPNSKSAIRTFLGMTSWLAGHLDSYAEIARPLSDATHKDLPFAWNENCQLAFETLKRMVTTAPVLVIPDPDKPFKVCCDASLHSSGAVLLQADDSGAWRPVEYFSRKFSATELKWATRDKECRAMLDAFQHWKHWLKGRYFTVETDHHSLRELRTQRSLEQTVARQDRLLDDLADFNANIVHVPGAQNGGADGLSRLNALTASKIKLDDNFLDSIAAEYCKNKFFNRILQRMTSSTTASGAWKLKNKLLFINDRLAVPKPSQQLLLMQEAHDTPYSNHVGTAETMEHLQRHFFWPRMAEDVKQFVKTCELCQRTKHGPNKTPGLLQPLSVPSARWKEISMDFMTKLPLTPRGHTALLVVVDRLTKRAHFLATTDDITAEQTAKLFFSQIIRLHGIPDNIVSDRDPKFTADFWQALWRCFGTRLSMSTANHAQSDGQTERTNRTLNARLRTLVNHLQDDWDLHLPMIEFTYNSATSSTTNMSPFEADLGYLPRNPLALVRSPETESVSSFVTHLQHLTTVVHDNIIIAQETMRSQADKHRRDVQFNVGDKVLVKSSELRSNSTQTERPKQKWAHEWVGPFRVVKRIGNNAYRIDFPSNFKIHDVISINHIKEYYDNTFEDRHEQPPAPIVMDTGTERFVHRILKSRKRRNQQQYLVWWQGEREDEATWEPEDNLRDGDVINEALEFYLQSNSTPTTAMNAKTTPTTAAANPTANKDNGGSQATVPPTNAEQAESVRQGNAPNARAPRQTKLPLRYSS
jgi:transposase InsO family protein